MDTDTAYQRLIEIQEEMDEINAAGGGPCECSEHLEIKIRYIGTGKHYVKQCNTCGEQRGNNLKTPDALKELAGRAPRDFDPSIEEAQRLSSKMRSDQWSKLWEEASRLKLMLYGQQNWATRLASEREEIAGAGADFSKSIDALVDQFGATQAVGFLVRETVRLKKQIHDEFRQKVNRFTSEPELKRWFEDRFQQDFEIVPEVRGRHLAENVPVFIDYVLKPKPHLIGAGFEQRPFGVEVKYFRQEDGFTRKTSRGLWQTISYNDCEFHVDEELQKLKFCLVFSNLSFEDELQLVNAFGLEFENDKIEWRGMLHLANHANVGCLNVKGTRDEYRGWEIRFVGGVYYSCSIYQGTSKFNKSNENVINKVRIGNF